MTTGVLVLSWMLLAPVAAGADGVSNRQPHQASQPHMGTRFTIVCYTENENEAKQAFQAAFARIRELDERLSDYRSDSELSRLSQSAPTTTASPLRTVPVSCDLWQVLNAAQQLSRQTDGAFDVTVGPLTKLWRRARRRGVRPTSERLAEARPAVGYPYLRLNSHDRSATLGRPNMRLDLGGIAKGFAADAALRTLKTMGIQRALVNGGGDIAVGAAPPQEAGWKVGIAPRNPDGSSRRFLRLADAAVATSGDAWQYVEIDGRRYSHIVDPRTGRALSRSSTVTVVAKNCMTADGLASAVSVLGADKGLRLIDGAPDAEVLILELVDGAVTIRQSDRFDKFLATD